MTKTKEDTYIITMTNTMFFAACYALGQGAPPLTDALLIRFDKTFEQTFGMAIFQLERHKEIPTEKLRAFSPTMTFTQTELINIITCLALYGRPEMFKDLKDFTGILGESLS